MSINDAHGAGVSQGDLVGVVIADAICVEVPEVGALRRPGTTLLLCASSQPFLYPLNGNSHTICQVVSHSSERLLSVE